MSFQAMAEKISVGAGGHSDEFVEALQDQETVNQVEQFPHNMR